jgi:hypothetical protein
MAAERAKDDKAIQSQYKKELRKWQSDRKAEVKKAKGGVMGLLKKGMFVSLSRMQPNAALSSTWPMHCRSVPGGVGGD